MFSCFSLNVSVFDAFDGFEAFDVFDVFDVFALLDFGFELLYST